MYKTFIGIICIALLAGCAAPIELIAPSSEKHGTAEEEQVVTVPEEGVVVEVEEEIEDAPIVELPEGMEYTLSAVPGWKPPEPGVTMEYRPAFFEIYEVRVGNTVDTWTKDGYFDIAGTRIEYKKGGPIFFLLYNGSNTPTTFGISVENAPLEVNYLRSGSQPNVPVYQAPEGFFDGVKVPESITIQPNSIYQVPFGFVVPKLADGYPENWEFRIRLSDPKNRVGNVVVEYTLRVVVYG